MSISQEEIEFFQKEGYLLVEQLVDTDSCEAALEETKILFNQEPGKLNHHGHRIQDAWKNNSAIRELAINQRLLNILTSLYHAKPFAFQTLNFRMGTEQRIHSDTIHFNSLPSGYMAGIWIALEDVNSENGGLIYYPKSHLLPEITMQDVGVEPDYKFYKDYENYIEKMIIRLDLQAKYAELKKGQAIIWHSNLLHGGSEHFDKQKTRYSQVTHYFFENCRYYTPMNSSQDQISWRNPIRIQKLDQPNSLLRKIKMMFS